LCAPPVTLDGINDTTVCQGSSISLRGAYKDDGTYGNNLAYHWEFNATGKLEEDDTWTVIPNSEGATSDATIFAVFDMDNITDKDTGYYRLKAGSKETIHFPKCNAASHSIKISTYPLPVVTVLGDTVICATGNLVDLIKSVSVNSVVRFYRDLEANTLLSSPIVSVLSDTVFYACAIDKQTNCRGEVKAIRVRRGAYPPDIPTTGSDRVCLGDTIALTNASPEKGVWSISNPSIIKIVKTTGNTVHIMGINTGSAYVSYTTGTGYCATRATFKVKVIERTIPTIIIGFEK
jgi:hypothetical protein